MRKNETKYFIKIDINVLIKALHQKIHLNSYFKIKIQIKMVNFFCYLKLNE